MKIEIELMTPAEVGAAFRVDAKTVTRWARSGKLDHFTTLGGHRRYYAAQINALLLGQDVPTLASIRGGVE